MTLWGRVVNSFMFLAMKLGDKVGVIKFDGSRLSHGPVGIYANCWGSWVASTYTGGGPEEMVITLAGVSHFFHDLGYVPVTDDRGKEARLYLDKGEEIKLLKFKSGPYMNQVVKDYAHTITRMSYADNPEKALDTLTLSPESRASLDYVFNRFAIETLET